MKNLVTGGAGFIGFHLINKLIMMKEKVYCLDNFSSGKRSNIQKWLMHKDFHLIEHDIVNPIDIKVDRIWHLACPASPFYYLKDPIKTSKTNYLGTFNALEIARKNNSPILFASSSEVYGNPTIHPQIEKYYGRVNSIGLRSCYSEGKRIGESLCFDYLRQFAVDVKIARLFNVYGLGMHKEDGRVITNFICNGLKGKSLNIYGDGEQTRSFCHIRDLIDGLLKLMSSNFSGPINLGNPYEEVSINKLAEIISRKINMRLQIKRLPPIQDDPRKRKPSIKLANEILNWHPEISLEKGLDDTIGYLRRII